jgi:hypothetical protein
VAAASTRSIVFAVDLGAIVATLQRFLPQRGNTESGHCAFGAFAGGANRRAFAHEPDRA